MQGESNNMEKKVQIGMLCEIYGNLLTKRQLNILNDYCNEDLSLTEIAENNKITRQAVNDIVKKGESKLLEYEQKLGIMKKTIAILLSVSCLFGLNSCFKTEEDIFDQSPAQRLNKLTSDYREVLSGSENGWALQYFASETEHGYPFVMKFDKSGKVTIAGNNSVSTGGVYKEESSTYDFVQDMSVVLTFDTYNLPRILFSTNRRCGSRRRL